MTWREFKAAVDEQIRVQGVTEDIDIFSIDVSFRVDIEEEFSVFADEDNGLEVF